MAEQEQVASKDDTQDTADAQPAPAETEEAAEAEAPPADAADSGDDVEAADPEAPSTPDAGGEDVDEPAAEEPAPAEDAPTDAADESGDGAPADPPPEPGFVSRILEEAVEEASQDLPMPSGDEASVDVSTFDEPTETVSPDELERTEEAQGFTGETYGETVSLDELETEEQAPADTSVYDQFRDVVDETSIDVREQDIVEGRVLRVNEDYVVIDIGYKSDGIVSRDEFGEEEIHPGDTVEVYLERKEDRDGQLVLSKEQADKVRRWQRVEEIYENEEVIEGTIIRRIKGGMIVELFDGMEAFLPGSQIDVRPVRDFESYLETRMEFKIVKLNPENENIVVSHRELIEHELEEQRQEILEQLEVGQVLEGTVKNIVDFGVFIDLGGVDGLLHITDLSWGRVSHPSEVVELDQELEVVVLDYEEERQRISLGLKQLRDHPWDQIGNKYDEDDVVEGKVVSITNYGAFVEIEKGIEGLVHISEMSWTRHIEHPSQMVSLGQVVDVKILNIDQEERKISLGMKQLEPDPWEGISDRYPAGTVLTGTVRNITNFGVFVEIEPGIDGLVHVSDLSWTKKIRHPGDMVDEEQELDVVILNIDEERRRISLGHKQVKTNPWDQFADAYEEGNDTTGEVVRVEDKGLVVQLPLDVEAFVPGSELKNGPKAFKNHYHEGDELELQVIRFDKDQKDIVLSETAKEEAERQEEQDEQERESRREEREREEAVRDFKDEPEPEPDEPTTGPTTLGELSGLADLRREMEEEEAEEEAAAEDDDAEADDAEADDAQAETPDEEEAASEGEAGDEPDAEASSEDDDASAFDETAGFPENFPRVSRLENAGVTSLADAREVDDLTDLDGIGSAYAEEISDALDEFDETGSVSS
ncbi:small subunit ribosomal protein S1 [Salinibacter ruber]|uniref:Small ribosomal subunit protein bS1 n=1 Tax=Salinibacter ruber TaxID=146919 RepID=A0AAW5P9N0_9BACT|nr:30S ribosomal protein S1 [Salinibacter ruber]MCS3829632.1 small subunit ribosomal protein S1 [Salinibacter ruber]MCS4134911.1 small subunit ribosomal protein S1 [Salinibacter ruber]MCS4158541.1 small subunit ribosomal protein S1 [Salinibacter ruber]MCS4221512.1 small subunit ribosomal protein S1 [Salinibacter ruber]